MPQSPSSSFQFDVSADSVHVNQQRLNAAGPPAMFHAIFGIPSRIEERAKADAPAGNRNNQTHYYDQLGITLNEHHYTHQIQEINLVFDPAHSHHPTKTAFQGILSMAGVSLHPGSLERALADSSITFTKRLPGIWFATSGTTSDSSISIAVMTYGPKLPSGRRSKSRVIAGVSFCLKHDPWDTSYRPEA